MRLAHALVTMSKTRLSTLLSKSRTNKLNKMEVQASHPLERQVVAVLTLHNQEHLERTKELKLAVAVAAGKRKDLAVE